MSTSATATAPYTGDLTIAARMRLAVCDQFAGDTEALRTEADAGAMAAAQDEIAVAQ